ncbi:MAG: hypothetical protein V1659_02115, partial [Candidatus Woesearchaeota archaeon]
ASPKTTAIFMQTNIPPVIEEVSENSFTYFFPNTPEIQAALQNFFDDIPLPCKTFSELSRSFHQQLMMMKRKKLQGGIHE